MTEAIIVAANTAACSVICWRSLCVLNAMTEATRLSFRIAYLVLSIGSFVSIIFPPKDIYPVLLALGVATVILTERRGAASRVYLYRRRSTDRKAGA